ncbi:hypothetical protein [Acinetobacter sp.]|uniref:hypothetical protein n=1 Tax=Acinetobacter sp. TaxID=472 RepID=UPI0028AAE839|nr:hypothetical protein [Acinetobacter sp.]
MRKKKILLSNFGYEAGFIGGQTIKAQNLYQLFFKLIISNIFIFICSKNNLKYLFPLLFLFCKAFGIRIYYIVIGGWLGEFLEQNPFYTKILNHIDCIYPKNKNLCDKLTDEFSFNKVILLHNFRLFDNIKINIKKKVIFFNFFMAKLTHEKYVNTLFNSVERLKSKYEFKIDIYSVLGDNYKTEFQNKYVAFWNLYHIKVLLIL